MNPTLAQLAHEAGITVTAESAKFAELIVLKCAEIADTAEPFLASDLIKEHFGIDQ